VKTIDEMKKEYRENVEAAKAKITELVEYMISIGCECDVEDYAITSNTLMISVSKYDDGDAYPSSVYIELTQPSREHRLDDCADSSFFAREVVDHYKKLFEIVEDVRHISYNVNKIDMVMKAVKNEDVLK